VHSEGHSKSCRAWYVEPILSSFLSSWREQVQIQFHVYRTSSRCVARGWAFRRTRAAICEVFSTHKTGVVPCNHRRRNTCLPAAYSLVKRVGGMPRVLSHHGLLEPTRVLTSLPCSADEHTRCYGVKGNIRFPELWRETLGVRERRGM
jgi:hypothetical protein